MKSLVVEDDFTSRLLLQEMRIESVYSRFHPQLKFLRQTG